MDVMGCVVNESSYLAAFVTKRLNANILVLMLRRRSNVKENQDEHCVKLATDRQNSGVTQETSETNVPLEY